MTRHSLAATVHALKKQIAELEDENAVLRQKLEQALDPTWPRELPEPPDNYGDTFP